MPVQPRLDPATWDFVFDANGDLEMVSDGEEVVQHIQQRLRTYLGEWPYDLSVGVPWFQQILGARSNYQRGFSEQVLKTEILETPGVTRFVYFDFSFNEANRIGAFRFHVDTIYGSIGETVFDITVT